MTLFTPPFRWEWVPGAGTSRPESKCVVFDANDEVVAACITDLHAADLCELLNASLVKIETGTSTVTDTVQVSLLIS